MFESLVWILLLALPIVLLVILANTQLGRRYDTGDVIGVILCIVIVLVLSFNCVHFYIVIERNVTADARLAEYLKEHDDLQAQVNMYSDGQALAGVMERVEKYNSDLAYSKVAAHSPWNAWSYPAKIYDNLEFVFLPEG